MRTHAPAFLLSALIHLGLLVFVIAGVSMLPQQGPPEETLAISLRMFQPPPPAPLVQAPPPPPAPVEALPPEAVEAPPPPPRPQRVVKQAPPPPVVRPKPNPPESIPMEPVKQEPTPVAAEQQQETEAEPAPQPLADDRLLRQIEAAYKIALRKTIEAHKVYPRRAVRLRQEGDILVGFSVRRDGSIIDLAVVESSGSALLDRAALEAVRQVDGTLPFPEEIDRSVWDFTLPINYSLH